MHQEPKTKWNNKKDETNTNREAQNYANECKLRKEILDIATAANISPASATKKTPFKLWTIRKLYLSKLHKPNEI